MHKKKIKAIALLSGGLDSIIASRLIKDQGIDVTCIYFSSPLWSSDEKEKNFINEVKNIILSKEQQSPSIPIPSRLRNKLCTCGSGKKFKKCCGK